MAKVVEMELWFDTTAVNGNTMGVVDFSDRFECLRGDSRKIPATQRA